MNVQGIELGSVGLAAMAYVSHITNHPTLCEFFLKVGVVGAVIAVIAEVIASIAKCVRGNKDKQAKKEK